MNKKIALLGIMVSLSLILSYIELLIPVFITIPGMKIGLANLVVVFLLYTYGGKDAGFVSMIRVIVIGFLWGNLSMMMYSLAGAASSIIAMILLKKYTQSSMMFVSIVGAIFHNIGQLLVAYFVLHSIAVFYYMPMLLFAAVLTGLFIGIVANKMRYHLSKIM
ncbi:MAG: Gx transporter family protein [Lachnospiraceae bacterium]